MSIDSGDNERRGALAIRSGADARLVIARESLLEILPPFGGTALKRIEKGEAGAIRVEFGFAETPFGECLLATRDGLICHLSFQEEAERSRALEELGKHWPNLAATADDQRARSLVRALFSPTTPAPGPASGLVPGLALTGTHFQHEVWRMLQRVPSGSLTTYGAIARAIGAPSASRAVGAAVGANRIAWLIPCHRVVQQNGQLGGFRWGVARKRLLLSYEQNTCQKG